MGSALCLRLAAILMTLTLCALCGSCGGGHKTARTCNLDALDEQRESQILSDTSTLRRNALTPVSVRVVPQSDIAIVDVLATIGLMPGFGMPDAGEFDGIYNTLSIYWFSEGRGFEIYSFREARLLKPCSFEGSQISFANEGLSSFSRDSSQYRIRAMDKTQNAAILPIAAKIPGLRVGDRIRIRLHGSPNLSGSVPDLRWKELIVGGMK